MKIILEYIAGSNIRFISKDSNNNAKTQVLQIHSANVIY